MTLLQCIAHQEGKGPVTQQGEQFPQHKISTLISSKTKQNAAYVYRVFST